MLSGANWPIDGCYSSSTEEVIRVVEVDDVFFCVLCFFLLCGFLRSRFHVNCVLLSQEGVVGAGVVGGGVRMLAKHMSTFGGEVL